MGGVEATKVCLGSERPTLLLGHSRGHGHGKKWDRKCHVVHVLRCGQGGAKSRHRGEGRVGGQMKGGTVGRR